MSDPYGPTPPTDPDEPERPVPPPGEPTPPPPGQPTPPPYGQPTPPPYGQPAPPPPYGQPTPPPYGQPAQPPYGQPTQPTQPPQYPQYGQPGPYGGMPTAPPPATPYGAAGYGPQLRVGDALRFAWAKFTQNWLPWVLFALLLGVVSIVFSGNRFNDTWRGLQDAVDGRPMARIGAGFGFTVLALIGYLISAALQALAVHAALSEADGARPSFGAFFRARNLWPAIGTAVLVSIGASIAAIVTFFLIGLGGLAFIIFTVFAVPLVLDHGRPAFTAIGDSFRLVGKNFGPVFLLLLALLGINILGLIPIGLGLLITVPLSILAVAYAFRRITGGTII
ncbi:hypothetical protein [Xylanimonas sp. McL0601]|uniref:hypothetical protein n=1 Tax=Xylanimonas sp. McL0601 TaxID=3414739 RepID=UPI003CF85FC4